jgi:hypothetical protein
MAELKQPHSRRVARDIEQIGHPLNQPPTVYAVALRRPGDANFFCESISQQVHPPSGHQERAAKVTRLPLHPINYPIDVAFNSARVAAQWRQIPYPSSEVLVEPGVQQQMAILVGKGRAQAVDALERAPQMAIDLHGRRLPCFESGNAMDLFALVFGNKVGVKIEHFGLILDKHRKSVGWQPAGAWP